MVVQVELPGWGRVIVITPRDTNQCVQKHDKVGQCCPLKVSWVCGVFTFATGYPCHNTFPSLCLWRTGLWGHKGQGGVRGGELRTKPRLWSFFKSTRFVLLHTRTPLAPLAQFTVWSTLTWGGETKQTKKRWQCSQWMVYSSNVSHLFHSHPVCFLTAQ